VVKATDNTDVFNITYKSEEKSNVKITILDENKTVVFTEVIQNIASFVRPYNFSTLEEGKYTIIIEGKNGRQAETVNYTKNHVTSYVRIAQMVNEENKYVLYVHNNGTETIRLNILGKDGNLLHEQSMSVTGSSTLVYDLNKVKDKENITFQVITGSGKVETIF
jgi:late competence protein required for DNA uptake (superfamily II DNA/RNA helicase)